MKLFFLLQTFCHSWGPIFHQVVAQEFASEYLSHLTAEQTKSFVVGSVFVDGLSRKEYHNIQNLVSLLEEYESNSTELEYYFVLGFILHMAADCSGHIGYPLSFLPLKRPYHYLAELTVCSAVLNNRKPPPITYDDVSERVYQRTRKGRTSKIFALLYKVWRLAAKFPFSKMLGDVENDRCKQTCNTNGGPSSKKNANDYAWANLDLHIAAIKRLMFDTLLLVLEHKLTEKKLGEIVINELSNFQCCV